VQNKGQRNTEDGERIDSKEAAEKKAQGNAASGLGKTLDGIHKYKAGVDEEGNYAGASDLTGKLDNRNVMKACMSDERGYQMLEEDTGNCECAKDIKVGSMSHGIHISAMVPHGSFVHCKHLLRKYSVCEHSFSAH
jgi:hypothetical protein